MKISHLHFESIPCGSCANAIERVVKNLSGVNGCWVSVDQKQATIQYEPKSINLNTIQSALIKIGYKAEMQQCMAQISP